MSAAAAKVTALREAAQKALDAFEKINKSRFNIWHLDDDIGALKGVIGIACGNVHDEA